MKRVSILAVLMATFLSMLSAVPGIQSKIVILPAMEFQTDLEQGGVFVWANALKLDYDKCNIEFVTEIRGQGFVLPSEAYVHLVTTGQVGETGDVTEKQRQCIFTKLQELLKKSNGQLVSKDFKSDFEKYFGSYLEGGFKPILVKAPEEDEDDTESKPDTNK